jgi:hypothetical protein
VTAGTWREALLDAHAGVAKAYAHRQQVFIGAHDAGLSLRAIGEVVNLSPAGVAKIVGPEKESPNAAAILDSPAPL